jgi:chromosome partitioning protein
MVITVASHKGGVGKSTTAVHLAAYLVKKAPTVLVDSDPNRSVCGWVYTEQAREMEIPDKENVYAKRCTP